MTGRAQTGGAPELHEPAGTHRPEHAEGAYSLGRGVKNAGAPKQVCFGAPYEVVSGSESGPSGPRAPSEPWAHPGRAAQVSRGRTVPSLTRPCGDHIASGAGAAFLRRPLRFFLPAFLRPPFLRRPPFFARFAPFLPLFFAAMWSSISPVPDRIVLPSVGPGTLTAHILPSNVTCQHNMLLRCETVRACAPR